MSTFNNTFVEKALLNTVYDNTFYILKVLSYLLTTLHTIVLLNASKRAIKTFFWCSVKIIFSFLIYINTNFFIYIKQLILVVN